MVLALLIGVAFAGPACAQPAAEGQKLAFDRGKGNCLTCHVIKGGDLPGSIGPVMPPFGRNRILSEKEISAVVDFLQTL